MRNYRIMIDISADSDVDALAQAADIAKLHQCISNLVCTDKSIRVDETGSIIGIVRRTPSSNSTNGNSTESPVTEALDTD